MGNGTPETVEGNIHEGIFQTQKNRPLGSPFLKRNGSPNGRFITEKKILTDI
jgi:hypothetical protein